MSSAPTSRTRPLLGLAIALLATLAGSAGLVAVTAGVASASTCTTSSACATATTLALSPVAPANGQSTTLVATVVDTSNANGPVVDGANNADGTVVFYEDVDGNATDALCSSSGENLVFGPGTGSTSATEAICTTSALTTGAHTIYADFVPADGLYSASSNGGQSVTVAATATASAVSVSPTAPLVGVPATITDTITPQVSGAGSVTFYDNVDGNVSDVVCSAVSLTNVSGASQATCQTTWSAPNTHVVYADYTGNSSFGSSSGSVSAPVGLSSLNQSLFANADQPGNWYIPPSSEGPNTGTGVTPGGCLTAGATTAGAPIPGCALATPDASGSGTLRLTDNSTANYNSSLCTGGNTAMCGEVGSTLYGASFPTTQGLDIKFNTYQWNGTGGDGIGFSLLAVDPSNPVAPSITGPAGGSLGYSYDQGTDSQGVPNGYLGLGLDVFGNYEKKTFEGTGTNSTCHLADKGTNNKEPGSVTVKGPGGFDSTDGEWDDGYCVLSSTQQSFTTPSGGLSNLPLGDTLDAPSASSRPATPVSVELVINTNTSSTLTPSGWTSSVPSVGWGVKVVPLSIIGGSSTITGQPVYLTGALPSDSYLESANPSWLQTIGSTAGIPKQLVLGWTASTGASVEVHEVGVFASTTANGQVPSLAITNTDSLGGQFPASGSANYVVTPALPSTSVAETSPVTVSMDFNSSHVTPSTPSGSGWSCGAPSGGLVQCTYPASAGSPIEPGTTLPKITVPVTISSASGVIAQPATASSADAASATATDDAVVAGASSTGTSVTGTNATRSVNQAETFTATVVTPSGGSGPVDPTTLSNPTSTVTFYNGDPASGGTQLSCTGATDGIVSGAVTSTSTCNASFPAAGTYTIYAKYNGDGTYSPSTTVNPSQTYTVTVSAASTTTAITTNPTPLNTNQSGQIVATITGPVDTTATNSGSTVTFYNGDPATTGTPISCTGTGDGTVNSGSQSTCTTSFPTAGTYPIYAKYSGDSNFSTSTSGPANIVVSTGVSSTTTSITTNPTPLNTGQSGQFVAHVSPTPDGGSVAFYNGNPATTGTLLTCTG
ncbi:MAG TPA: Ig-like domain repeat protein, partial [Acidimicrobiales bacterium]|nr:Ig-like domain repeat protein [Acidimicrobiales bacterium]